MTTSIFLDHTVVMASTCRTPACFRSEPSSSFPSSENSPSTFSDIGFFSILSSAFAVVGDAAVAWFADISVIAIERCKICLGDRCKTDRLIDRGRENLQTSHDGVYLIFFSQTRFLDPSQGTIRPFPRSSPWYPYSVRVSMLTWPQWDRKNCSLHVKPRAEIDHQGTGFVYGVCRHSTALMLLVVEQRGGLKDHRSMFPPMIVQTYRVQ